MTKVDLIIHPVRFRILQTLAAAPMTTQALAAQLDDVPQSSLYRHLKLLLEGAMIEVAETRLVNGIQEKVYRLKQWPYLDAGDMAGLTAAEHLHYFTTYILTLLQDFARYLDEAEARGVIDLLTDRTGYTEVAFWAAAEELEAFQAALHQALQSLVSNPPGDGRRRHKLAILTHPLRHAGAPQDISHE